MHSLVQLCLQPHAIIPAQNLSCVAWKSILDFKYLLKYSKFTVLIDHSVLKNIYCSSKVSKTNLIQKFLEELSDYHFQIKHVSGKHMYVSDLLSCFSYPNTNEDTIPFLSSSSSLTGSSYITFLDKQCHYNYSTHKSFAHLIHIH